jgi:hypothetical protein
VQSARWALERGARHVSLIPTRASTESLSVLAAAGDFTPPTIESIEGALTALAGEDRGVVTLDLWDLEQTAVCPACLADRRERFSTFNRTGELPLRPSCQACDHPAQ